MTRKKPTVVYTRPRDWFDGGYSSDKLNLVYVPISGDTPKKKNGKLAGDSIGDVIIEKGRLELYRALEKHKPEILLHWIHRKMNRAMLERCRKISPNTLIIVGDGNQPNRMSAYVHHYREFTDGVLLNNSDKKTLDKYRSPKKRMHTKGYDLKMIGMLCDGFKPADHPVNSERIIKYDCLFAGSNLCNKKKTNWRFPEGRHRFHFIRSVAAQFNTIVYGEQSQWNIKTGGVLRYPHYFPKLQEAKIILGFNHYQLERYYTRRTIHGGASGRLFITKYIPGMEKDFTNHRDIVWFRNKNEGMELIRKYLKDDNERRAIAERQRKRFLKCHSWQARLSEFEDYVYRILGLEEEEKTDESLHTGS